MAKKVPAPKQSGKINDLVQNTESGLNELMTTDQGLLINDDQNSLKAGERGATLLEDFILREKITHFDHERIPERIVHARGAAAHGIFELYQPMGKYTKAKFLNDTSRQTPVFVRFSTVAGSRGSTDLARDVRGFAVKFYTEEGNYDLVGNNIPVFFIQDAMKFPDLIHAVKPEPHNEIPQAASAHDTFWDFISLMPEATHMIMWAMSDRALPRSFRMMEGFGVHTFRFINDKNESFFVKFHWKPLLGVHSVAWDEAQQISGKDADFHRRDLWDAIEAGAFPEWEFGVQIIPEADEHKFDFDLLDPTKLVPEELVPVMRIGKMTLNRNPDNFFAETEQVAFHPGHLVPGIDFTNDPLLQGRLFSYTDTQLSRLGSPNFHEIPINRSLNTVHNNQRDGHMRQQINKDVTSYHPNTIGGGCPYQAKAADGGFTSHMERIDAKKIRGRSKSFFDHFSQATLFFNSQSAPEQNHIIDALRFELSNVTIPAIRERMLGILSMVDKTLAQRVADKLGMQVPKKPNQPINHSIPADGKVADYQPVKVDPALKSSAALSMANSVKGIKSRKVAILAADGVNEASIKAIVTKLTADGASGMIVAPRMGQIKGDKGNDIMVNKALFNTSSVLFDAVYIPGGQKSINALVNEPDAIHFINQAYRHCKAIGADKDGGLLLDATYVGTGQDEAEGGIIIDGNIHHFVNAVSMHRSWEREPSSKVPA
ncbi:catalase HPII [Flavipsychrobacter stenotrophus]|uniref:Catalase n=1 Tax=Flavipsychrobacter stenotrophus TaxID=2077091 RepID=A0A2S7ST68_9BACT|nr:catalase [Flavipsychrobacter stenotrophus]PQJ09898.1 catalase HPII [Flavipsychrobacter stenotrophus]